MLQYTLKRIISSLVVLLAIITITFFLMHAIPGGPFTTEKNIPPAILKNIEEHYRLHDPLWQQYLDYLTHLVHFDLGPSFKYEGRMVADIIRESFPVSFALGISSIGLAAALGIPAGIIAAVRRNQWPDYTTMFITTLGMSVPSFVIAVSLIHIFAVKLGMLPAALWEGPQYAILPAITLASYPTAFIARLTRSSMLEVLTQDYIRTARAKGLSPSAILYHHALKNALIPTVTYLGPMAASILTGSFVVETIFAIPGLGRHFVMSIYNRDYTVILGVTVFYSLFVIGFNLLVDLLYPLINPRIKLPGKQEEN